MHKRSVREIIKLIENRVPFEATAEDGSFTIKINRYVPFVCTAIHDGDRLRKELKSKIELDEYERWYEEDPYTGDFISSLPITLIGHDSRFEYDLNRDPENCIYEEAWNKKVWKKNLSKTDRELSLKKHRNYYRVTEALIRKLESEFEGCVVYDMHSYNWKRWDRKVPVFNVGVENVDTERYAEAIELWKNELEKIEIPNIETATGINDTFYGRGYNLKFITERFKNTLVLATEVSKIYCDELTGEDYPDIIQVLRVELKKAIVHHATYFLDKLTNWPEAKKGFILSRKLEDAIVEVDSEIHELLSNFEVLTYVNPNNEKRAKKKFFKSNFTVNPEFTYDPIKINAFELKNQLHSVNLRDIKDISIQNLYESVINGFTKKIDLLSTLDTEDFKYNSLRYFGRPDKKDLRNAKYIMLLPSVPGEARRSPRLGAKKAVEKFRESFDYYGFQGNIEISNQALSEVMVLNSQQKVVIRKDAEFEFKELNYLAEHEVGVHMVTTMNSIKQPLKVFNLGLPINTLTQEGLAVLAEYLSGNITMKRLKVLALRVIVVDLMASGSDFKECFNYLIDEYQVDSDLAWSIVVRVFRGGGFTKDHLYLKGFVMMLNFWKNGNDLTPLLIGKTSLEFYNTINEMMDRKLIHKPEFVTRSFAKPQNHKNNEVFGYVLSGLIH